MQESDQETASLKHCLLKQHLYCIIAFLLGLLINLSTYDSLSLSYMGQSSKLWLVEPKDCFQWNQTELLQWTIASYFTGVAASPKGQLYGIQKYGIDQNIYQLAYEFNFTNGQWNSFDKDFQVKQIKFDKNGNFYLQDLENNVYSKNSFTKILLRNIRDYQVTTDGRIYAISLNISRSDQIQLLNTWIKDDGFQYKLFSSDQFKQLGLKDEIPIFVDINQYLVGYGQQCVNDISVGIDGSIWALSCEMDVEAPLNFQLIKWDPYRSQWYKINGIYGAKIAAFNEISVAIVDDKGRITFSSEKGRFSNINYSPYVQTDYKLFQDSRILNQTSKDWVISLRVYIQSLDVNRRLCSRSLSLHFFSSYITKTFTVKY
eukprot:403377052